MFDVFNLPCILFILHKFHMRGFRRRIWMDLACSVLWFLRAESSWVCWKGKEGLTTTQCVSVEGYADTLIILPSCRCDEFSLKMSHFHGAHSVHFSVSCYQLLYNRAGQILGKYVYILICNKKIALRQRPGTFRSTDLRVIDQIWNKSLWEVKINKMLLWLILVCIFFFLQSVW